MQAKISIELMLQDKAIKQSRDLKYVLFLLISNLNTIPYCAGSCAGLQKQKDSTEDSGACGASL